MTFAALILAFAGWAGVCFSMSRHYRQLFDREPPVRRARLLRLSGWTLIGLSLLCAVDALGWRVGSVEWIGLVSVSGASFAFLLPYWPRHLMTPSRMARGSRPGGTGLLRRRSS